MKTIIEIAIVVVIGALIIGGYFLFFDKPDEPDFVEVANPTAPANGKTAAAMPTKPVALTAGPVGVAECDSYLSKYEACVNDKLPEPSRAQFKTALERTRADWKKLAASDGGREGLAAACREALSSSKGPMNQYGCSDF